MRPTWIPFFLLLSLSGVIKLDRSKRPIQHIYLNVYQWALRKGGTDTAWFWFNSEPKGLMAMREKFGKD